jgi:hypothetical protein
MCGAAVVVVVAAAAAAAAVGTDRDSHRSLSRQWRCWMWPSWAGLARSDERGEWKQQEVPEAVADTRPRYSVSVDRVDSGVSDADGGGERGDGDDDSVEGASLWPW